MTKSELIEKVYGLQGDIHKREVDLLIAATFAAIREEVAKNGRFSYPGFGTFTVRERQARTARNPATGDPIEVPASKGVGFKPAPKFKAEL
jgi:DNA-binding protein HU-beta